jgi:hypothetical protein
MRAIASGEIRKMIGFGVEPAEMRPLSAKPWRPAMG